MKIAFVSNYINHHQIPFCNEMYHLTEGAFTFVQTEPMETERVNMGWHETERPPYVKCWYEEEEVCRKLVMDCDVVIFGGTDEESYIQERLRAGKFVMRYSERLYKTGQWKAVSPRGLRKKYQDHTRYRKGPVYLLCAGAYVPSDFTLVGAYPGKRYCWGYFPETKHYDLEKLFAGKGYLAGSCGKAEGRDGGSQARKAEGVACGKGDNEDADKVSCLLWAARMIDWKHPELALETARHLKEQGISFHLDLVGDGPMRQELEELCHRYGLEDYVDFQGFQPPEKVRGFMEKADIFLFTSDRQEGWGAVANEAMNSGCALVADVLIGAAPYLVRHGENGLLYPDGDRQALFQAAERLAGDRALCRRLGRAAYETITETWNAEHAAGNLLELLGKLLAGKAGDSLAQALGGKTPAADALRQAEPCSPAPVLWEHGSRKLCGGKNAGRTGLF